MFDDNKNTTGIVSFSVRRKFTKFHSYFWNIRKFDKMFLNFLNFLEFFAIFHNFPQFSTIFRNFPQFLRYLKILRNISKILKLHVIFVPVLFEVSEILRNVSKNFNFLDFFSIFYNFWNIRNVTKCFKFIFNFFENFPNFLTFLWEHYNLPIVLALKIIFIMFQNFITFRKINKNFKLFNLRRNFWPLKIFLLFKLYKEIFQKLWPFPNVFIA